MHEQQAAGRRLVALARPYLDRDDKDGLAEALDDAWSPECLSLLLDDDDDSVAQTAATCLGLIGQLSHGPVLARLLHHDNPVVVGAAEDALWSIWLRAGGPMGRSVLARIADDIRDGDMESVVPLLTELIRAQPTYAEAHHQRSQAHYLTDAFDRALRDARRAHELNPLHFGALAIQAHALVALGRLQEALRTYRSVLKLHPRMPGIRASIRRLRDRLTPIDAPAAS